MASYDPVDDLELPNVGTAGEDPDRFMSVAQVARRLGCSVSLVQKWRRLEWLPATQLGPPDVPIYGYRSRDVDRFATDQWNRRRGRPPGATTAPEKIAARAGRSAEAVADLAVVDRVGTAASATPPRPTVPARSRRPRPPKPVVTGPLVVWAGDPRRQSALLLRRLPGGPLAESHLISENYARRYEEISLSEALAPGVPPSEAVVLAYWRRGTRVEE